MTEHEATLIAHRYCTTRLAVLAHAYLDLLAECEQKDAVIVSLGEKLSECAEKLTRNSERIQP